MQDRLSKLALMKKGLRQAQEFGAACIHPFKTCPDEEGIKTFAPLTTIESGSLSKLALMKKGLRQRGNHGLMNVQAFKTCPDEEGIKTGGLSLS